MFVSSHVSSLVGERERQDGPLVVMLVSCSFYRLLATWMICLFFLLLFGVCLALARPALVCFANEKDKKHCVLLVSRACVLCLLLCCFVCFAFLYLAFVWRCFLPRWLFCFFHVCCLFLLWLLSCWFVSRWSVFRICFVFCLFWRVFVSFTPLSHWLFVCFVVCCATRNVYLPHIIAHTQHEQAHKTTFKMLTKQK